MMCLGVVLFGSNLFGTLCFLDLYVYFFHQIREVSFIIFSNKFSTHCSSSSPSGTPMIWMLAHLEMSQNILTLSLVFWILVYSFFFCSGWMFILPYVPNHWFESQFPSLHCWFPMDISVFPLVESSFLLLCFCCIQWDLWAFGQTMFELCIW